MTMLKGTVFEQQLDFTKACFLQGLCTRQEYAKAKREIYEEAIKDIDNALKLNERSLYANQT